MKPEFIDTHCHLEMDAFDNDRDDVIKRAQDANVKFMVNAGSDLQGCQKAISLSSIYTCLYTAVGIHPHEASSLDDELYFRLRDLAGNAKVVAIGEIGLDYHYMHSPKGIQIDAFRRQIALAKELGLPVIVHSREAKKDTMRILHQEIADTPGVMHCFSGDKAMARDAMEMGFCISIAGPVTFKSAQKLKEIASFIPDEFLLIETDAPYLSPVPMRGKRNEPAFIINTARTVAEVRGITIDDLARITTHNAKRLFGIGDASEIGEIAYRIRNSLYLNITNRCTNRCGFCVRFRTSYVKGHNLRLEIEPTVDEIIRSIGDPATYDEVVFCGIGEPLLRLDAVKKVSRWIKDHGGRVRINTNGHGNLINGRNILPELKGLVDSVSVSLDAENEKKYRKVCRPSLDKAFNGVIDFIKEAKINIPDVRITVVDVPEINILKCKSVARRLGVKFRVRKFNVVG